MEVDVAIVGGGPAGCSTALALLEKNLSVTVVDSPMPRRKPSETTVPILPRILSDLRIPQAIEACEPCYGIDTSWGRKSHRFKSSIMNPLGHAWFVHRDSFDSILRCSAQDAGAIWVKDTAHAIVFHDGGITLCTSIGEIQAKQLVIANGSPACAARFTGQNTLQVDALVALWADISNFLEERILRVEPAEIGWWYLCPNSTGGASACLVTEVSLVRNHQLKRVSIWNQFFQQTKLFSDLRFPASAQFVHVVRCDTTVLPRKCGPRWIAVGDAAAKLDPIGSGGVVKALISGKHAASAILEAFAGNFERMKSYDDWNSRLETRFINQRGNQYVTEAKQRFGGFWSRRHHSDTMLDTVREATSKSLSELVKEK